MDTKGAKKKILIADEEPSIINLLVTTLEEEGYDINVATTGREIAPLAVRSQPDLILLGAVITDLNGFEVCEQLKANDETKEIPVIFIDNSDSVKDRKRGLQAGGVDYITQPLAADEALMRIKLHLSYHELQKQCAARNSQLQQEIIGRQTAEEALSKAYEALESKIEGKSDDLLSAKKPERAESKARDIIKEAISENAERYRIAVNNSNDGIAFIENRTHKHVNEAYAKLFGYDSPDELLGEPLSKVLYKEQQEYVVSSLFSDSPKSQTSPYAYRGVRKDGRILDLEISKTGLPFAQHGKAIINVRDISKQKKLQGILRHSQKMEAIGTLAGGIAHDFNNILGIIIGCTQLSLSLTEIKVDTDLYNYLTHILNAGFRAQDLVQQILFFNRQKEGERKPLQIGIIVKEALKMLRASIPSTISIRQDIDKEIGKVLADVIHIHQIMLNLCSNAAHAMRKKGGVLDVSLNTIVLDKPQPDLPHLIPGRYALLTVSDTREEGDENRLQNTFNPDFTISELEEGAELGLAVVHDIIQSYQGAIRVHRKADQGSVCEVFIPQLVDDSQPEATKVELKKIGKKNVVILLIDDDYALLMVTEQMLTTLGYSVESYHDSTEALSIFSQNPNHFDLVITDMTMPGVTGLDLTNEILRIRPEIPVFLCTGFSDQISEDQAKSYGIREFLLKPIDLNLLADKLAKYLNPPSDTTNDTQDKDSL